MSNAPGQLEGAQRYEQPAEGRRAPQFLRAMTAAIALAVAQILSSADAQENKPPAGTPPPAAASFDANDYIRTFPRNIRGIACYHEDIRPGATRAMVYIRQSHWSKEIARKDVEEVRRCQEEIYAAIDDLIRRGLTDTVYDEGRYYDEDLSPHFRPGSSTRIKGIGTVANMTKYGAVDELLAEGRLRCIGAENRWLHRKAADYVHGENAEEQQYWLYDAREDAALRYMMRSGDSRVSFTVWGAAHSWANNIRKKRMQRDEEEIFSVLTLTPPTVLRLYGELPQTHFHDLPEDADLTVYPSVRPEYAPMFAGE